MSSYRPYRPTPHAEQRRLEMQIPTKELKRALNEPTLTYPADPKHARRSSHHRTIYQRGRIVLVVDDVTQEVVTIMWHGQESRECAPPPLTLTYALAS